MSTVAGTASLDRYDEQALHRTIGWSHAFWVASGVPALVLFSIGAIAATVGSPSWIVWTVSIAFGFLQAFTYAEIAGLFPQKSGGASVYGAIGWLNYGKLLAPISVWCNWFAWSPVLSIGTGLAAGYILGLLFPADSAILTWQVTLLDLGFITEGLTLRLNATFLLAACLMLVVFAIQHHGILRAARVQLVIAVSSLVPLVLIGLVPILSGNLPADHFLPIVPLARDATGAATAGGWNMAGITLFAGGLFIAAWSTYGFETAVCYTAEFRDPARDTFKAIFYSGLLCILVFTLVPVAFQGALGVEGMVAPGILDGSGVGLAMASMVGATGAWINVVVVMLLLSLLLSIMTAMAGSSRTLYQGGVDGWLPSYLGHVNEHGAPTRAMWTDLGFNLILLLMSNYVFVLAASNVGYLIFNFLNLNSGWIHRIDRPDWARPFRCPSWLLATGAVLGFVNLFILGMGANIWGAGTLVTGLVFACLIIPVFLYRHYVVDRGRFPAAAVAAHQGEAAAPGAGAGGVVPRAGMLPYLALAGGVATVVVGRLLAQ